MSDELKRCRITLTFEIVAKDAPTAAHLATVALVGWQDADDFETQLLGDLGPYELAAVEIGATVCVRRGR